MTWLHYQAAVHDTDHRKTDECGSGSAVAVEIARHAANVSGGPSIPGMYPASRRIRRQDRPWRERHRPADRAADRVRTIINLETAKELGIEIPATPKTIFAFGSGCCSAAGRFTLRLGADLSDAPDHHRRALSRRRLV